MAFNPMLSVTIQLIRDVVMTFWHPGSAWAPTARKLCFPSYWEIQSLIREAELPRLAAPGGAWVREVYELNSYQIINKSA